MTHTMAADLRRIPVLSGNAPQLDIAQLPSTPSTLFQWWLEAAVEADVPEPHAMTVSTMSQDGIPDARVLTLKDFGERGWAFASTKSSAKGQQLDAHPYAALSFWWQPLVRSIRIRGKVVEASHEESLADLAARSAAAQRDTDPADWTRWWVVPEQVEFWQGAQDRRHHRIVYRADGDGWMIDLPNSTAPTDS
ncbi:MAG TPA: pyridoxamine 5'-phosphate oxidase family protein [Enteractinococcus sp.]